MTETKRATGKGKAGLIAGIVGILAVIAFASNPDISKHRQAVDNEYRSKNPITGMLGAGSLVSSFLTYQDRFLFSTTVMPEDPANPGKGKSSTVTFGILGKVFVLQNLDIAPPEK